ncbi:MAG TPA: bifunctional phosphopantothenoylcysteine decarboxylase/phosphopantothenate--cysteine ligase CoaBC, partial [Rhodocyclaceae bacterium]|nr:bifunctional phosphopantothenoylcysteine decarboxylase/phosphopantothenate--cysteine ligase CoaBC [Rhodocyclaceae bacterium]
GAAAVLIAPASADIMAKLAHGLSDDLLSTLCLARDCPLLVAPAMNRQMWHNPATQRNVVQLKTDGVALLGPDVGEQACGEFGEGRMLEAYDIFEGLIFHLQPKLLAGKRILMTAGPTFEAIDPVRGMTNISSGKMGYALARACAHAGAEVTLISGPVSLPTPFGVQRINVRTGQEMHDNVMAYINGKDVFIGVAAVADYRATQVAKEKIKKTGDTLSLELSPNVDILATVATLPNTPFCVGFAAESQRLDEYANGKRIAKKLPLIVGNLVQDGMGGDTNVVTLYDAQGKHPLPPASKDEVARGIVAHLAKLLTSNS